MNVLDFLGHGAENAIPADTLAAMLQVSPRKLRSLILRERDAGELILYRPGGRGGYFLPSLDEEQAKAEIKKDFTARLKALEDSLTAQDPVAIVEPVPGGYLLKTGTQKGAIVTMNELNKRYDVVIIDDVPRIKESE